MRGPLFFSIFLLFFPAKMHAAELEAVPDLPSFSFWKNVELAEAQLGLQDYPKVLQTLAALPPEPEAEKNPNQEFYRRLYFKALTLQATAINKMGQDQGPVQRRIWALFPDFEDAVIPTSPPGVSLADKIDRLHVLHEKKQFDSVPSFLSPSEVASLSGEKKCRAIFELGNSFRNLKKNDQALVAFSLVTSSVCQGEWLARSLYWKGKLELDKKDFKSARDTYELFRKNFSEHQYADDALYALWKIHQALGENTAAASFLEQLLRRPGDMGAKYLFEKGYAAYRKKKYREAIPFLDQIIAASPLGELLPQALYWKARCLDRLGGSGLPAALQTYQKIAADYPFSFYSVLASHRLNRPTLINPKALPVSATNPQIAEIAAWIGGLNRQKLNQEAQNLLDYLTQIDPSFFSGSETLLAKLWQDSGDFNQVLLLAAEQLKIPPFEMASRTDDPMIPAFYPQAFPDETNRYSLAHDLPRHVLEEDAVH